MSFGGAVSAMVTSLKNNRRKRPSAFEKMEGYENDTSTKLQFDKKATPQQLADIKQKLQKENRQKNIRLAIYIALFFLGIYILYILT